MFLSDPSKKYRPFPQIDLPERKWPTKIITKAPIWCAVDLRDGNQALVDPMDGDRKMRFFDLMVRRGFREIEVGFPSASQTDYDFLRELINTGRATEDVALQVLMPAREELIDRTFEGLEGAKKAIVHLYNSTNPTQRRVVFQKSKQEILDLAVQGAKHIHKRIQDYPSTKWIFEYSPESFSATELDYAIEVCNAVMDVFKPTKDNKIIFNLPATVELATPNVHADQIEYFCNKINNRDSLIISLHPHNDRGTAVAAAELGLLAGADRVEGTLFGNGERTGNVDIVALAMNMYTQGVAPGLDLSDINELVRVFEYCNQMPVHKRHPYAGELVFTAFSGSHQDAIRKGLKAQKDGEVWDVPYLPIDPDDLGRAYEPIIRINSQSGKGGVAFVLEEDYGLNLPRGLQVEFGKIIQDITDKLGGVLTPQNIWDAFSSEYLNVNTPFELLDHQESRSGDSWNVKVSLRENGKPVEISASGNGLLSSLVGAISKHTGLELDILSYSEHAAGKGSDAKAVAYVETGSKKWKSVFGVGMDTNVTLASMKAVLNAVNRGLNS